MPDNSRLAALHATSKVAYLVQPAVPAVSAKFAELANVVELYRPRLPRQYRLCKRKSFQFNRLRGSPPIFAFSLTSRRGKVAANRPSTQGFLIRQRRPLGGCRLFGCPAARDRPAVAALWTEVASLPVAAFEMHHHQREVGGSDAADATGLRETRRPHASQLLLRLFAKL